MNDLKPTTGTGLVAIGDSIIDIQDGGVTKTFTHRVVVELICSDIEDETGFNMAYNILHTRDASADTLPDTHRAIQYSNQIATSLATTIKNLLSSTSKTKKRKKFNGRR